MQRLCRLFVTAVTPSRPPVLGNGPQCHLASPRFKSPASCRIRPRWRSRLTVGCRSEQAGKVRVIKNDVLPPSRS
jgi:hypothetical protein